MRARRRNDLELYERAGDAWWRPESRFAASLHRLNALRLRFLRHRLGPRLEGLRIADLGCGGGLLALPLAARGARMLALDRSLGSLRAGLRQADSTARVAWLQGDCRRLPLADESVDCVLLADVIEHLSDWPAALAEAARILRPGGGMYCNTLNRTLRARLLAVHLAEGLGLVPAGTHDPRLFVQPGELQRAARSCGLRLRALLGEEPQLLETLRRGRLALRFGPGLGVGYSAWLQKR